MKFTKFPVDIAKVLSKSCPNKYFKNAAKTQVDKINSHKEIVFPDVDAVDNLPEIED